MSNNILCRHKEFNASPARVENSAKQIITEKKSFLREKIKVGLIKNSDLIFLQLIIAISTSTSFLF